MNKGERSGARAAGASDIEVDRLLAELASGQAEVRRLTEQLATAMAQQRASAEEVEALRRKLHFAEASARDAIVQLREIQDSPAWHFTNRLLRNRTFGALWRSLKSVSPVWLKQEIKGLIRRVGARKARASGAHDMSILDPTWESEDQVAQELDNFISGVERSAATDLVVFVAGVKFVETEGQRVTQLIREFIRRDVPVLLLYYRWRSEQHQPVPKPHSPHFFQVPMDMFARHRNSVIERSMPSAVRKTCVFEFPHPWILDWVEEFNRSGWNTVYDVIDDWEAFDRAGKALWYKAAAERRLCEACRSVTAVSEPLANKLERWMAGRKVTIVPNGVSPDSFDTTQPAQPVPRGELTVGYFGFFTNAWFDWKLVAEIATNRPTWQFHLVGFGEPVPLELPENVRLLGRVPHHLLYRYSQNWDVAMVPFKTNAISDCTDPIKVYEYLALGLPVVTGNLPHLRSYPGVHVATSSQEFEQLLQKAASQGLDPRVVEEFLDQCTWHRRGMALVEVAPSD